MRRALPILLLLLVGCRIVVDPGPGPEPEPRPEPGPTPRIGLHVLIVEETEDRRDLPASQLAIFTSTELREWLDENTTKESGRPAWRIWDVDTDLDHESDRWKTLMRAEPDRLPWIWIVGGREDYAGPLPETVDATMELLRRHQ